MTSRYVKQLNLPEIGAEGQQRLGRSHVAIVGCGGLGAPAATLLAGAGVGHLTLIDHDTVSLSNLHRQTMYREGDIDQPKATCAASHLRDLNSEIRITAIAERLTASNIERLLAGVDLVIDACDNFATRLTLGDYTAARGIVLVHGAVTSYTGQVCVFNHPARPCSYRQFYAFEQGEPADEQPAPRGVIGMTPTLVAAVQASEALKCLTHYAEPLAGKMWTIDLRTMRTLTLTL